MNREQLMEAVGKQTLIAIDPNECIWNEREKRLEIHGEDWQGYIPLEEMGLDKKTLSKTSNIIVPISKLFNNTVYAYILKEEDGVFLFSRKEYLDVGRDSLQVGGIYKFKVDTVYNWGIFGNVEGIIVLVHEYEYSDCHFNNLRNIVKVGEEFPVRILKKEFKDGEMRIYASRKQVGYATYRKGEKVSVKIGEIEPLQKGFFCEITPNTSGIIDVPPCYIEIYHEGDELIGIITGSNRKGYKLDCLETFFLRKTLLVN